MQYKYSATTKKGDMRSGEIEAASKKDADALLKKKGLLVISIKGEGEESDLPEKQPKGSVFRFGRVTVVEKVLLSKNLAVMIKAGLPLKEALDTLLEQSRGKLRKVLSSVLHDIDGGKSLAEAMEKFPKVFPEYYTSIVRASEESGTLEENLEYLAEHMESDWILRRKIRSAMLYPVFVLGATGLIGLGLAIFVLPKVTELFTSFDVALPLTTRMLLWVADVFQNYGVYIAIGAVIGVPFLIWFLKRRFVKPITHRIILGTPVIKNISRNLNLARFSRTLGVLLQSGIPIDRALSITDNTLNNYVYRKDLKEASEEVQKGKALSVVLDDHPNQFPKLVTRMIKVGEGSGKLEGTLLYLARYYEEEVDNLTKNLATILEPILLVIIGVIAGGLALSIITPIYQLTGSIGNQ
ncbi:type II secretion system F family protein [Patescibacteria group bacterium]|nr:type II secretion system F family protein [Patescibacteria group bacterium]MBU1672991.1 type II secretion system F family protein [Patescibacteria group bacterium]MBU1962974.1 type II secretion system F family protein [Patescibacteria group bacterium]